MNVGAEVIVIKKPSDCSEAELQDFAALILAGGEVTAVGLDARIKKAEAIVFLLQNDCLKGIAAVKNPEQNYKSDVFQKANASVQANDFPFEIGWVFVLPSSRGSGLSHKLVQAALSATGDRATFATSRSDNTPMHKVLNAHGFSKNGGEYASTRGNQNLVLFVSNVAPQGVPLGDSARGAPLN